MNPLYAELWWFVKVGAAIFSSGWWLSKQVSRIEVAVKGFPVLKSTVDLHGRQIQSTVLATKQLAGVVLFPTSPASKEENRRVINEFDAILRMHAEKEKD